MKTNTRNELIKILLFILSTIGVFAAVKLKCDKLTLWQYEKNMRMILVVFACVLSQMGLYFAMKPQDKPLTLLHRYMLPLALAVGLMFIGEKYLKFAPFILPLVLFMVFYNTSCAFLFQSFVCVMYYFTGFLTEELLILYMFYSVLIVFIVHHSTSVARYILSGLITIIAYIFMYYSYQYMIYEKVDIKAIALSLIPIALSIVPLYVKFILIIINDVYLRSSLRDICDDENELLLMLMERNSETYFHSIQVADVAVRAAKKLHANVNLVNAGARFHEIGRLESNDYIPAGIQIMKKNHFPAEVIRIVREHNSKTYIPKTLESAIVMLSDTIETTINQMIEKNGYNINKKKIVGQVIDIRFDNGVLDDAIKDVTLYKELRQVFMSLY